jgi:serine/threonine protein kinase
LFYISPEVIKGSYNELYDIWSSGVILYILLSGYPPFFDNSDNVIMEKIRSGKRLKSTQLIFKVPMNSREKNGILFLRKQRI